MGKPKKLRKLIKAAKMGKPCAMYRLGICFETGNMTEKDLTKAAEWISAAAEAKSAVSRRILLHTLQNTITHLL